MATEAELLYVIKAQDQDLKKLQREVKGLNKELGQTGETDGPEKLSQKLDRTGDSMVKTGKKATVGLTLPIVGMGVAAFKAFNEVDAGADALTVATGATGKQLDGLQKSFRKVAGQVPDDFAVVGEAMGELQTRTGLSGKALEHLTKQTLDMARITGGDAVKSSKSLTRAMGDWGVPAKDGAKTLDMLFVAGQKTGVGFDQLASNLAKFGGPMRQMGFDMNTTAALLGKFEKEGVNAELVMGSMRIALGKMAQQGVKDPQKALALLTARIKDAGTAGEANKIALETFGARAGPDMAAAIREGRFEVGDLAKELGQSGGAVDRFTEETMDGADRQKIAWNQAKLAMEPFGLVLSELLSKIATTLGPMVQRAAAWFQGLPGPVKSAMVAFLGVLAALGPLLIVGGKMLQLVASMSPAIKLLSASMSFLAANPIVLVIVAIAALAAGLVIAYQKSETFRAIVDGAMRAVAGVFTWLVDKGKGLVSFFTDTLPGAAKAALNWVKSNWPAIATIISGPFAPLVALATDAWGVRSALTNAIGAIKTWVTQNWKAIATIISGPFAPLVALATDAFGVRSALVNALSALMTTAGGWATRISSAIKTGFMTVAWDIPKALYDRIIQPMINKATEVLQKAKDLSAEIPKGIKAITWGLIDTFRDRIIQPLVDLADNALRKGGDIAKAIGRGIREGAAEVWDKVTDSFKTFLNKIIQVVNKVPFVNIPLLAQGGVIGGPTLAVVGEDGPEVVIPLGKKRRRRGVELMTQAASIMGMEGDWAGPVSRARGMGIPMLANGGFVVPGQYQGQGLDAVYAAMLRSQNNTSLIERAAGVLAKGVGWVLNQIPKPSFGNPVLDGLGKTVGSAAETAIKNAFGAAKKYNLDGITAAGSWARSVMGRPYVWGGGHGGWNFNLGGYDCSGFASHAAKKAGSSIGAPGTTMSLFPASSGGRGPVMFGFRGMGSNDPRRQHMGAKILSNWYQFGNPGHMGGGDGQWDSLRVPPGLASYQRGTPHVPADGPAYLHRGEKVVPREGSLVHIENYYAGSDTDAEVLAAGLSRKLALGGVG